MNSVFQESNINELIIKFLSGNSQPDEDAFILEWKKKSEENRHLFNMVKSIWIASSQLKYESKFNTRSALKILHRKTVNTSSFSRFSYINNNHILTNQVINRILKIAAAIILIFVLSGISSIYLYRKLVVQNQESICRYEAPKGSRAVAYLPDGTKVWLNAGSVLEYSTNFNLKKREVKLTGEGFFKVKTNRSKPFIVIADNLSIKAFGTSFNIKAYPEEKQIITTLVEGEVKIEGKGTNNKLFTFEMKPKQRVVYFKDENFMPAKRVLPNNTLNEGRQDIVHNITALQSKPSVPIERDINVRTELYTSWKDSLWIIQSEKLEDLAILLERRYNVTISFTNDELKKYRFSGTIQNETLEQVFEIIRLTMPVSYSIEKGQVSVMLDQGLKKRYKLAYHK
jgi:ferric-dicitrate binding protein FerR (iron transport regulator)